MSSAVEHRGILQAALAGDKRKVKAPMQEHIGHTRGIWGGRSEARREPAAGRA
jgi:DNA-binding GntR family transcriptional regulator